MEFDIENDLWEQAEFPRPTPVEPSQPVKDYRASLFDYDISQLEYEHKPEVKYVRGRPLKIYNQDERPGGHLANTIRQIREVSGLGYSNELIEQSVQNYAKLVDTEETQRQSRNMPDLTFKRSTSASTSSRSSPSESKTVRKNRTSSSK